MEDEWEPDAVIGIDPSLTKTGVAILYTDRPRVIGTVSAADATWPMQVRLYELRTELCEFIIKHCAGRNAVAVVERGFSGGSGPSAWALGAATGAILLGLEHCNINALLVPPKVRAKLATGSGNAGKEEVLAAAIRRLNYDGHDKDVADALWLAEAAARMAEGFIPSDGLVDLPATHLAALDKVGKG